MSGLASAGATFHGTHDLHASVYRAVAKLGVPADDVALATVAVPTGSCLIHHQDVWHGSRANVTTDRPRRALALHLLK